MFKPQRITLLAIVAIVIVLPGSLEAQSTGWAIRRSAAADLWFHGLALVGLSAGPEIRAYAPGYAEGVIEAKRARGLYPTRLDEEAESLLEDLADDQAFQTFHFLPLYFPDAEPEEFLRALRAVADEKTQDAALVNRVTRPGVAVVSRSIRSGSQRDRLKDFVELLEDEWEVFFAEHWEASVAEGRMTISAARDLWMEELEPALEGFLTSQRMDGGTALVSQALGPEGRMYEGVPASRSDNVVAVALPHSPGDEAAVPFAMLHEICYAVVNNAMRAPGVRASQDASSNGATRCGSMILDTHLRHLRPAYDEMYLALWQGDGPVPGMLAEAYPLDDGLEQALEKLIQPPAVAQRAGTGRTRSTNFGWVIRPQPQADLWYHTFAVIQADQPGPLGMYSAEYATYIRDIKRERGVYPTPLDSIDDNLRSQLMERHPIRDLLHFVPVYFSRSEPEEMMDALMAVAERNPGEANVESPEARYAVALFTQAFESGGDRRVLREVVEAMREEWTLFYRDYWDEWYEENREEYDSIQELWDRQISPSLAPFLEERRLSGGLAMPTPGVGPEGRIVDPDPFQPDDQVVAMMFPLTDGNADASAFAFLKELCFLIIDAETLRGFTRDQDAHEDLERRAAVRCGAMLLEFYAPVMATRYRRAFLNAVGAEESSTQGAFERVFYLEPEIVERLKENLRRNR